MVAPEGKPYGDGGFTLLEVMIAVAILGVSMTSLLTSQVASIRATRYAQALTSVTFLAEYQMIEVEYQMQKDGGWVREDRTYEGNFADQGWPKIKYTCLVDFIELPDYSKLREAKEDAARAEDESGADYKDASDQAFTALGLVWPMVKQSIENSIRKAVCTVTWSEGQTEYEVQVSTFWTKPEMLTAVPGLGGEALPGDDEEGKAGQNGGTSPSTGAPTKGGRSELGGMRGR